MGGDEGTFCANTAMVFSEEVNSNVRKKAIIPWSVLPKKYVFIPISVPCVTAQTCIKIQSPPKPSIAERKQSALGKDIFADVISLQPFATSITDFKKIRSFPSI